MKYLTAAQMREADRRCIEEIGIPGAVLMNNAGTAVFESIHGGPVGVVCGKGNNGGDGYVAARLALLDGRKVRVVVIAGEEQIRGDAQTFLRAYRNLGGEIAFATTEDEVERQMKALSQCAVLVDAVLGTGVKGEVEGLPRVAIDRWPRIETVAVDLPSGLNADTGEACGNAIKANTTVTFQFAKAGFQSSEAKAHLGELVVADIGIPPVCGDDEAWAELQAKGH